MRMWPDVPGKRRLAITAAVIVAAFLSLQTLSHGQPVLPAQHLRELAYRIANWRGENLPLPDEIVQAAGVNDYVSRDYTRNAESAVQLYIGYYASQSTGDTIHSPKNCLPGTGWDPVSSRFVSIPVSTGQTIQVNEYVVQRDQEKQLVLYWYQGRGRIIASEYSGKFWMIVDAMTRNRTDGALVRLNTSMADGREKAYDRLVSFTQAIFPKIDTLIPR